MTEEQNKELNREFNDITKTLHINVAFGNIPLPMKIIALLTSAGGLSIIASIFADIVRPNETILHFYLLRIVTGLVMIFVGYGIIKQREWSLLLYGMVSVASFLINPIASIIPILITLYLIWNKHYFVSGKIKWIYLLIKEKITSSFKKNKTTV